MIGAASAISFIFAKEQIGTILGNWLLSVTANKYVFLFAVNIIILILGSNPAKEDSLSVQFKSTSCIIRSAVKCIIFRCDPWTSRLLLIRYTILLLSLYSVTI